LIWFTKILPGGFCPMAKKLDPKKTVTFKDFLIANAIQIDALTQLLIENGLITEDEYFTKLQYVQAE
jgi:hypothetical protein